MDEFSIEANHKISASIINEIYDDPDTLYFEIKGKKIDDGKEIGIVEEGDSNG